MSRYSSAAWRAYRPPAAATAAVNGKAVRGPDAQLHATLKRDCRVLGLDPGSLRTGYGVIDCRSGVEHYVASGCISVKGEDLALRLRRIFEAVQALIDEHRPDEVAVERVFVHRNPDSALKLGQARGAALCAAVAHGASMHEYAPRAIKLAVTGYGAAEKPQVAQMVVTLLSLARRPAADAADALAVALCHSQSRLRLQLQTAALRGARG
jgi:crossover junction endodeoxyribonuclease RuvC